MKIVHVGAVHWKNDIRIFVKECTTLVKHGYDVTYITSDIYGDKKSYVEDGVKVRFYHCNKKAFGLGKNLIRQYRLRKKMKKELTEMILDEKPDVIHLHEHELFFVLHPILKKRKNIKFIYDIHEDNPAMVRKQYEKSPLKRILMEKVIYIRESKLAKMATAVIVVTDFIEKAFIDRCSSLIVVRNYPKLEDIAYYNEDMKCRENIACYAGVLAKRRGIVNLVKSSAKLEGKIILAGDLSKKHEEEIRKECNINEKSEFVGKLNREQINGLYQKSVVGICTILGEKNHVNALPIKMFEYMASGIPVVCSDFPLWKKILDETNCGIAVNPNNVEEITDAIQVLFQDRDLAKMMGDNGRRAVEEKYNWAIEEKKLLDLYSNL